MFNNGNTVEMSISFVFPLKNFDVMLNENDIFVKSSP